MYGNLPSHVRLFIFFSLGSIKSLLGSRGLNIGSRSLDGFMIFEGSRFINYEII